MDQRTKTSYYAMNTSIEISVVIATYNRVDLLRQQVASLLNQSLSASRYEIIIVNDGSTDGTAEYLETLITNHTNINTFLQHNRGPAAARNLGVAQAQGAILAFTDDDCLVSCDWLATILDVFKDEVVLAAQGKTVSDKSQITPLTHQVINEQGDTSIPTCNAAYRKSAFVDLGGFDTDFPFQNEDADLAWRTREKGRVVFSPEMLVVHPPRVDRFGKSARKMQNYVSEFMLFHKNPVLYQKYRQPSPWKTIYWRIMVQAQGHHFLRRVKYIRRPWLMIQGVALSLCWWGDLLYKLPTFWRADRHYQAYYANSPAVLGTREEVAKTEKLEVG
jgi:glycosyltransferase involved in cell wall biosynthesis